MSGAILVIDDDLMVQRILARMLSADGFQVETATTAEEGFKVAARQKPDLILCDIMMPDVNGLEFIQRSRQMPEMESTPIILISASSDKALIERGLTFGAFAFLTKPFSQSQVKEMVKLALEDHA